MDCEITYKGKDYTYDQFATLLHSGELEVLAPKMDSRYFIVNEGYNPFENKQQDFKSSPKIETNENGELVLNRLRTEEEQGRNASGQTNAEATILLARLHKSIQDTYGKDSREAVTIANEEEAYLEDYAKKEGIWIDDADKKVGTFIDNGQEQFVYVDPKDTSKVIKLNDGSLSANWLEFMDRIALHNANFPSTKYTLKGFGMNSNGNFVAILEQPFIQALDTTPQEIKEYMEGRGFEPLSNYDDSIIGTIEEQRGFINKKTGVIVEDLHLKNVLKDSEGNMFVIDPVISLDTEDRGYEGTITRELPDMNFKEDVVEAKQKLTLPQARKSLKKAWNKLGNQGIVYDPLQNERDFIDFVKALFDYVKVYGRDKAIPEMTKYVKAKLGIGGKGELKPESSNAIEQYAQSLLNKYSELTPNEIDAVLSAFGNNVGKESFTKNVDTMVRFGKMKTEKANQFKELYNEVSKIKLDREEEAIKTMGDKPKFDSPIQILLMDVGNNENGKILERITQITTNNNQERSDEDIQKDTTYIEESLERLRNIAFDDASMLFSFYNSSPDWVLKFLNELEQNRKDAKTEKAYLVKSARLVGILNVMNNDTYERIIKSTDPIEREELMKLRDRLDSFTNDTMRDISLGLNARRSDMVLAEFARGGVLNDYATSRILTKNQTTQLARIQEAIKVKPTKKQLNNVNIPTTNPTTPSTTKSKPKASSKKKIDAKFEVEMIEESKKAKGTSREERAKELRDRLFNAINKCK